MTTKAVVTNVCETTRSNSTSVRRYSTMPSTIPVIEMIYKISVYVYHINLVYVLAIDGGVACT